MSQDDAYYHIHQNDPVDEDKYLEYILHNIYSDILFDTSASLFGQKAGFAGNTKRGRSMARAGVASLVW